MSDAAFNPRLVRLRELRAELVKKRDRLNVRIEWIDKDIAELPDKIRRYDERDKDSFLGQCMLDPRKWPA